VTAVVDQVRSGLHELLAGGASRPEVLPPDQERLVQLRRAEVVALLAPMANLAHMASILVIGVFVLPDQLGWERWAWTVAMLACAANSVRVWLPRRADVGSGALALRGLHAESWTFAVLYGLIIWRTLSVTDLGQATTLIATLAGVIGAGAIQLSIHRSVALSWVWSHSATVSLAFLAIGGPTMVMLCVQLLFYGAALTIGITYLSASFAHRCRAELAAEAERSVVRVLLDDVDGGARDWLWQLDAAGRLRAVSDRFAQRAGVAAGAIDGGDLDHLFDLLDVRATPAGGVAAERLLASIAAGEPFRDLEMPVSVQGRLRWWAWSARPLTPPLGTGWTGVIADVTEERLHQDEILRLATVDELTGLANRHRFAGEIEARLAAGPVALGIVDLDHFKEINDSLGHATGDQLLREVAARLVASLDPDAFCARLGGDEFALVLPGGDPSRVERQLHRAIGSLRGPFAADEAQLTVSGCLGYATAPVDADRADELLRLADLALYDAKERGHGSLQRYEPAIGARARHRATARQELGEALQQDQIEVWYQPKIDLRRRVVVGVEALVRWRHPERGIVPPGAFIEVAEETGMIVELGAQVLAAATAAVARLPESLTMAINVSAVQLASSDLPDLVRRVLADNAVAADRLVLEITESQLVHDEAIGMLRQVRDAGVQVSIDDFGTGYSSFATLRRLPIDEVKVDRSFVAPLDDERLLDRGERSEDAGAVLVSAILSVAAALSLRAVAEGIETEVQAEVLRDLGCTLGQGYRFGRPMPLAELLDLLERWSEEPAPVP
jgi:diguanylate cyclase (GGDEF)-like protein